MSLLECDPFTVGKMLEGRHSHHIHHMEVVLQNTQEPEVEQGSSHSEAVVGRELMCLELGKELVVELGKPQEIVLGKESVVEMGKEQVVELDKELAVALHMTAEEAE